MEETLDFSQTQRIVFLIDLYPLFHLQNPQFNSYTSSILASARTLLTFPSLSSSFFAFNFFVSSLSPILSTSKVESLLGRSAASFSFNSPSETLASLSKTLNFLSPISETLDLSPRASLTASSLRQFTHHYSLEPQTDDLIGNNSNNSLVCSNLVLLFSPVFRSLECLSEFLQVGEIENVDKEGVFREKFFQIFGSLKDWFVSRDIHFSWISVNYVLECGLGEDKVEKDQAFSDLGYLQKGLKSLGWGFSSTDAITLGSSLIPFGLIYPNIGCSPAVLNLNDCGKKYRSELSLKISDVKGEPLECNYCELELLDFKLTSGQKPFSVSSILETTNSSSGSYDRGKPFQVDGDQIKKICIREVRRNDELVKFKDKLCHCFLVRGFSVERKNNGRTGTPSTFFADRVLEMLRMETREFTPGKPSWQVLLTFLHRESYAALVSVLNEDELPLTGLLKPFTVNSAFLYILDGEFSSQELVFESQEVSSGLGRSCPANDNAVPNVNGRFDLNRSTNSPPSKKPMEFHDGKVKRNRKSSKILQNLSWSSFCEATRKNTEMELEDIYLNRECNNSKKFKFLKCWMKQIRKFSYQNRIKPIEQKQQHSGVKEELGKRLVESEEQESEQPISSSFSTREASVPVVPDMNEVDVPACPEASETFFGSISEKIQQSLVSAEVDLGALAERLVSLAVHWLYWKHEMDKTTENTNPKEAPDYGSGGFVASELVKLLLRDPKELAAKYKGSDPSDPSSAIYTSQYKVREFELQILFRMEILRSKVGDCIEEIVKQKMVKQICSFLDIIQCHLEGGFFGEVSLDAYVKKNIKDRYSDVLEDVVRKIYTRMDLLLFEDGEGQASGSLLNSEDSVEPPKEKVDGNEFPREVHAFTMKDTSSPTREVIRKGSREEREEKKRKAQEMRERNKRLRSFTSWMPNLQMVKALKQRPVEPKSEGHRKVSKRKERQEANYTVVCETPMTWNKRSKTNDEGKSSDEINFSGSVSKALFQDNGDSGPSYVP